MNQTTGAQSDIGTSLEWSNTFTTDTYTAIAKCFAALASGDVNAQQEFPCTISNVPAVLRAEVRSDDTYFPDSVEVTLGLSHESYALPGHQVDSYYHPAQPTIANLLENRALAAGFEKAQGPEKTVVPTTFDVTELFTPSRERSGVTKVRLEPTGIGIGTFYILPSLMRADGVATRMAIHKDSINKLLEACTPSTG